MRDIFKIKDINEIYSILDNATYGTLALSKGITPYSVPINFVRVDNIIYFHGSKRGKKMEFLKHNKNVSFSVVESEAIIPSYFSSNNNLACPATTFFRSVIIEGVAEVVTEYNQKVLALNALMKKLQSEGKYIDLSNSIYKKSIDATNIIKIVPYNIDAKAKLGQNLKKDRFNLIIKNLKKRGLKEDLKLINLMRRYNEV